MATLLSKQSLYLVDFLPRSFKPTTSRASLLKGNFIKDSEMLLNPLLSYEKFSTIPEVAYDFAIYLFSTLLLHFLACLVWGNVHSLASMEMVPRGE